MGVLDEWVCRVPRAWLRSLAADPRFRERERVLMALLAALFSTRDGGSGVVSVVELGHVTGLDRRSVRRVMDDLLVTGVLEWDRDDPPTPGKARRYRLTPGATYAPGLTPTSSAESAPGLDQNRARSGLEVRQVPGATSAPPSKGKGIQKEFLKKGTTVVDTTRTTTNGDDPTHIKATAERVMQQAKEAKAHPATADIPRFTPRRGELKGLGEPDWDEGAG